MDAKVRSAGFSVRKDDVRLWVEGKLMRVALNPLEDTIVVDVTGLKEKKTLALKAGKGEELAAAYAKVENLVSESSDRLVTIEGLWRAHSESKDEKSPPVLTVVKVAITKVADEGLEKE